jgi:two-component system, OmpR family, sensor histidine kinase KdpD
MEEGIVKRGELGHGGHFMVAVTGSGNSEYLIRWTDSTARRLNATWTALHIRNSAQDDDGIGLERNFALVKELGAETISIVDSDVAACIVRYARIKKSTALVIGKADEGALALLGRRSIMGEILKESGDLDVIILRGTMPLPHNGHHPKRHGSKSFVRGVGSATAGLLAVTILGLLAQPVLGYRSVSILYLVTIITLPFVCSRSVVFASAVMSALLWNYLFIPPKMTFSIASLEDILMFLAFFFSAFVGGFLTSRLKEKEMALSLKERRMAFLYGFTRAISRVRGIDEVARFTGEYLLEHLGLHAAVYLRDDVGGLESMATRGVHTEAATCPGFEMGLGERCFKDNECINDGDDRLYLPLGSQESILGILYVTGNGERIIRGESREILATLAGNMALAMERELLASQNERNKMAAETARLSKILLNHVSHELRTPLTTIKGAVSGLLDGNAAEDPGLRNDLLAETMIAANKLNVLVEDLLAMSRLEAGRMSPHPELVYINELIGAAQVSVGLDLSDRTIIFDEAMKDFEIYADPVLIMQVFRNIIRNFVTYTNPGATLHINANHGPDFSVVSFADDGPGVQERELPLLFDTFYRGSGCGGKLGSGLGLSICRGIIEVHGGSIEASAGTEGGLLVTLKLPKKGEA